jgi:hypothetical protein
MNAIKQHPDFHFYSLQWFCNVSSANILDAEWSQIKYPNISFDTGRMFQNHYLFFSFIEIMSK